MSRTSLKEQLQAVASKFSTEKTSPVAPAPVRNKPTKPKQVQSQAKPKWLEVANYGVELLKAHFPAGFKDAGEIKPLKVGIKKDLVKRLSAIQDIVMDDKACMVKSLSYYVNTGVYLKTVIEGSTRIDLDGNPAGQVTGEEEKYSKERQAAKLKKRQAAKSHQLERPVS